jgi:xanthine dehydrogenase large subunit
MTSQRLEIHTDLASPSHDSAVTHVQGSSEFVDDRPAMPGELYAGIIYSRVARGVIRNLDLSQALKAKGVVAAVTAKDVHHNFWGPIFKDQPLIASDEVQYAGEVVAVLAAESPEDLQRAMKLVKLEIEARPWMRSIAEAVRNKSFIGSERSITRGDAEGALLSSENKLSGVLTIQGADHFYLESNAAIVYPKEQGQFEVHSSTQHPTETQHIVAEALGVPFSNVVCITKRLGGGFGGKESQAAPFAAYAALIAQKTRRPTRLVLTKDDDMIVTGKRNPFEIHWTCGFSNDGMINALDAMLYSDGGAYADLSTAIMERAMLHSDNAYFIPHMRVRGQVCRTNYHPHTAFRGFGGPKGVALIESIIEDIALVLGLDSLDIRKKNTYRAGHDITHYGQKVDNNLLPQLFDTLEKRCDYRERRKEIDQSNQNNIQERKIRGLSMTAVKFGISFTTRFLNQANALVNVHRDGSIQVSTGAVEMGQGVNQRITEIVAMVFGSPLARVRVMTTSTEKNANTSPTAASSGTDLNGAAAEKAALAIKSRLAQIAVQLSQTDPDLWPSKTAGLGTQSEFVVDPSNHVTVSQGAVTRDVFFEKGQVTVKGSDSRTADLSLSFSDLVNEAYLSRASLCEYAHYRIENLGFNKISGRGQAFLYFTQGVAATEVELDLDTGEVKVLRSDILMDLGRPVNIGLDIGQISGGFVQGQGWVTTENLVYNKDGFLLSHSPSTYKIPSVHDKPREFRIELVRNEGNIVNVRRTKASGEPPLLLAISVWTAIKDAVARHNNSIAQIQLPATSEVVLRSLWPERFA